MALMKRTDEHRPSAIEPADYAFVACDHVQIASFGDAHFAVEQRKLIQAHMLLTGGTYSQHAHGGVCMVCGNTQAQYTSLFYHAKSNTYVRVGSDCSEKIFNSDFGLSKFRAQVEDVREYLAGKQKAQALLADMGLSQAWDIYTATGNAGYDLLTISDIVGKLVKYGSVSEKTVSFLRALVVRVNNRPAIDAAREAEKAAAADCPKGRIVIEGTVVSTKTQTSQFGTTYKMLVKHASGFKVYGTIPSSISVEKGDVVTFTATVEPSNDDRTFGFFSRPVKASVKVTEFAPEAEQAATA
jgi:hypothetical protein